MAPSEAVAGHGIKLLAAGGVFNNPFDRLVDCSCP